MKELLLYHGSKIKHMNTCVHMNKRALLPVVEKGIIKKGEAKKRSEEAKKRRKEKTKKFAHDGDGDGLLACLLDWRAKARQFKKPLCRGSFDHTS